MDMKDARARLADFVRDLPRFITQRLSKEDAALAVHLRGNESLLKALTDLIDMRIKQRASVSEPLDAVACKSMIARDRELQWLLNRLEAIYRSPLNEESGEPPA